VLGLFGDYSKSEVKKSYHKLALVWHPDSIKRHHKYCFANEKAFTALVVEIFQLIDQAY
jgi:DnaJ-class molecular chaperone